MSYDLTIEQPVFHLDLFQRSPRGAHTYDKGKALRKPYSNLDEEALYIISGEGVAKIGEEEVSFKQGDALYIPAATPHCIKKTGSDELKAVYCHSGIKE